MNTVTDPLANPAAVLSLPVSPGFTAPASRLADLPGPGGLPVFGNALQLTTGRSHQDFENWGRQYGPMYRLQFGAIRVLATSDPVTIHEALRLRPAQFSRGRRLTAVLDELGTAKGLFNAEGEVWRRHRKLVMRALTPEVVKHFFPIIVEVTRRLQVKWASEAQQGRPVNAARDLKRYSVDVTTWLSMGVDIDTLNHDDNSLQDDVEFWFEQMGRRMTSPVRYWRWFKLPVDRKLDAMLLRMQALVESLIAEARQRLAADPARRLKPPTILEALVAARDEAGSEFTDEDVEGNIATMLFAGEDTTANAMAWLLYHLATEPAAAQAARAETDRQVDPSGLVAAFAELDRFEYLEGCINESMRLKPIAPVQAQTANVPMEVGGVRLEPGDVLMMLPRLVGVDEKHFPDPLAYRPERWLAGNDASQDVRRKVFPFGGGPRFCPGRYLAMVEMKMVAAMALRGFDLAVDPVTNASEHFTFTMGPEALALRLQARPAGPMDEDSDRPSALPADFLTDRADSPPQQRKPF